MSDSPVEKASQVTAVGLGAAGVAVALSGGTLAVPLLVSAVLVGLVGKKK